MLILSRNRSFRTVRVNVVDDVRNIVIGRAHPDQTGKHFTEADATSSSKSRRGGSPINEDVQVCFQDTDVRCHYKNECLPYDRTNRRKMASRILPISRLDLTVGNLICAMLKCTGFGNVCLLMLMLVGAWYAPCRPCVVLDVPLALGECRQFR